jgi:hypothetical protein
MPDEFGLISYEEALEEAERDPDAVEQSALLRDFKNSPRVQRLLRKKLREKLIERGVDVGFMDLLKDP